MATKIHPVGSRFADWSYANGVMGPLEAVGVTVGSRYLAPSFNAKVKSGKCFSIPERNEMFLRGWGVLLNWENNATDALGGAAAGKTYGKQCYNQLREVEYPVDPAVKLSVSCDTDARKYLQTVTDYYHAFQDNSGEYAEQINAYGGSYVCNALPWISPHWLTVSTAWSDPGVWSAIGRGDWANPMLGQMCAFQTFVGSTPQWDMDVLIKPVTVWSGLGSNPIPDPIPVPDPITPPPDEEWETMINIPVTAGKNETWESLAFKAKQFGIDVDPVLLRSMNEGRTGTSIPVLGEGNQLLIERLHIQPNGRWLFVS